MNQHSPELIVQRFRDKVALAKNRNEADLAFFVFLREFAAKRAPIDHALLEAEAGESLKVDEPEDIRDHLMRRVADVRSVFAKDVVETLDHIPPVDREIYWIAATYFHEMAFDRLIVMPSVGGCC